VTVAVAPTNRNRIVVTTVGDGILWSRDGGRSWGGSVIDAGEPFFGGSPIVFDPQDERNVYVDVAFNGLLRSTDGGQTFTTTPVVSVKPALAIDPQHPNVLYLPGFPPGLLLRSSDGGLTFADAFSTVGSVNGIVINPQDPKIVYIAGILNAVPPPVATANLVLRSTDGGVTFTPADAGLSGQFFAVGIDPLEPTRLFALYSAGFFETEDGGTSWNLLDPGGETFLRQPETLAINPKKPKLIYLGGSSLLEVEIRN
jgi:photosystem II stability/assembly factor-like uncharacterized protein